MRAAVQHHLASLSSPVDVVLHPRKSVLTMDFARLEREVEQIFAAIRKGTMK